MRKGYLERGVFFIQPLFCFQIIIVLTPFIINPPYLIIPALGALNCSGRGREGGQEDTEV